MEELNNWDIDTIREVIATADNGRTRAETMARHFLNESQTIGLDSTSKWTMLRNASLEFGQAKAYTEILAKCHEMLTDNAEAISDPFLCEHHQFSTSLQDCKVKAHEGEECFWKACDNCNEALKHFTA